MTEGSQQNSEREKKNRGARVKASLRREGPGRGDRCQRGASSLFPGAALGPQPSLELLASGNAKSLLRGGGDSTVVTQRPSCPRLLSPRFSPQRRRTPEPSRALVFRCVCLSVCLSGGFSRWHQRPPHQESRDRADGPQRQQCRGSGAGAAPAYWTPAPGFEPPAPTRGEWRGAEASVCLSPSQSRRPAQENRRAQDRQPSSASGTGVGGVPAIICRRPRGPRAVV